MKCISVCLKSTDCQEFMRKPIVLISLLIFPEFSREVFHNILYHEINSSVLSMVPNFTALISARLKSQTTLRSKSLEHWFSNWLHTNCLGNFKKSWCLCPPFLVGNSHPTQEFGSFYCHPQPSWPQSVGVRRDQHAWIRPLLSRLGNFTCCLKHDEKQRWKTRICVSSESCSHSRNIPSIPPSHKINQDSVVFPKYFWTA